MAFFLIFTVSNSVGGNFENRFQLDLIVKMHSGLFCLKNRHLNFIYPLCGFQMTHRSVQYLFVKLFYAKNHFCISVSSTINLRSSIGKYARPSIFCLYQRTQKQQKTIGKCPFLNCYCRSQGKKVQKLDIGQSLLSKMEQLLLINMLSVPVRYITFRKWPFSI